VIKAHFPEREDAAKPGASLHFRFSKIPEARFRSLSRCFCAGKVRTLPSIDALGLPFEGYKSKLLAGPRRSHNECCHLRSGSIGALDTAFTVSSVVDSLCVTSLFTFPAAINHIRPAKRDDCLERESGWSHKFSTLFQNLLNGPCTESLSNAM
jgi:hypothetical protein